MRLSDLTSRLPANAQPPRLVTDVGAAFEVPASSPAGYVEPDLIIKQWPVGASVLLIEAAGAVGKSSAAAALATTLKWPLVRAERARVGSHSLSGIIQDALGFTSTYIQQIATGTAGVVVDSLDEAHFKVGTDNFLAFMENVASVSGAATVRGEAGPSILLLSRADTAEYVRLYFEDANFSLAHAQIDFFDRVSTNKYIDCYLRGRYTKTSRPEYNVSLAWPKPFEKLRDDRIQQMGTVMLGGGVDITANWDDVKDFLGYAPVLSVLAESLAVPNPSAERGALKAPDSITLLQDIIGAILDREHDKFGHNLAPKLIAQSPADSGVEIAAQDLYGAEEQQIRLLSTVTGARMTVDLPTSLPAELRTVYNNSVDQFLKDHPFIRNRQFASRVFGDFVWAATAGSNLAGTVLDPAPVTSITDVGPFFAGFIHSMNDGVLTERLVEPVLSSWIQESEVYGAKEYESFLEISSGVGHLRCMRIERNGVQRDLQFQLTDISPVFVLKSALQHLVIATDQCISLAGTSGVFQIGPGVLIACDELELDAETLRVETDQDRPFALGLACARISADRLTKIEGQSKAIHIYGAVTPPLLAPFRTQLAVNGSRIAYSRYMDLRSILTAFKGTPRDYLAASADKIDQVIVRDNPNRLKIFQYLQAQGAVSRRQSQYTLNLAVLGTFGISLGALKSGPNDSVLNFLVKCGCSSY
jgi:hypothetical protein